MGPLDGPAGATTAVGVGTGALDESSSPQVYPVEDEDHALAHGPP